MPNVRVPCDSHHWRSECRAHHSTVGKGSQDLGGPLGLEMQSGLISLILPHAATVRDQCRIVGRCPAGQDCMWPRCAQLRSEEDVARMARGTLQGHDAFRGRAVDLTSMGSTMLASGTGAFSDASLLVPSVQDLVPAEGAERGDAAGGDAEGPCLLSGGGASASGVSECEAEGVKDLNLVRNHARRQASTTVRALRTACEDTEGKMEAALAELSSEDRIAFWREAGLVQNRCEASRPCCPRRRGPCRSMSSRSSSKSRSRSRSRSRTPRHSRHRLETPVVVEPHPPRHRHRRASPAWAPRALARVERRRQRTPQGRADAVVVEPHPWRRSCLQALASTWTPCKRCSSSTTPSGTSTRRRMPQPSQNCKTLWPHRRPGPAGAVQRALCGFRARASACLRSAHDVCRAVPRDASNAHSTRRTHTERHLVSQFCLHPFFTFAVYAFAGFLCTRACISVCDMSMPA